MLTSPQYFTEMLYTIRNVHIVPITNMINVHILRIIYPFVVAFQRQNTFRIDEMTKKGHQDFWEKEVKLFLERSSCEILGKMGKFLDTNFLSPPQTQGHVSAHEGKVGSLIN